MPTTSTDRQPVPGKRKRRFRRQPDGHIQLTERDAAIIQAVYHHRFLRSTHLLALFDGGQGLVRRLAELYHHAYLDRPREQIEFYQNAGSKPMVYALGNKGADFLTQHCGVPRGKIDWTAKNHGIRTLFLEHTLLVADVMVAMELACRQVGRIRLVGAAEIVAQAPGETRRRKKPLQWTVNCLYRNEQAELGVIPDAVFALHYLERPEGRNRAYFFLEADRATMPVARSNLRQTSFFRKMVAYHATWKQELHARQFGIKNFRVLTVTSSPERVANLLAAHRDLNGGTGSKMFLFTDEGALKAANNLLALPWRNSQDDEPVRLLV